jgi:hypothetical protein
MAVLEKAKGKGDRAVGTHRRVQDIAEGALHKKARVENKSTIGGRLETQASRKAGTEGAGKRSGKEARARNGDKSQE